MGIIRSRVETPQNLIPRIIILAEGAVSPNSSYKPFEWLLFSAKCPLDALPQDAHAENVHDCTKSDLQCTNPLLNNWMANPGEFRTYKAMLAALKHKLMGFWLERYRCKQFNKDLG